MDVQFDLTGEYRAPREGDWYLSNVSGQPLFADRDESHVKRVIVKEREQGYGLSTFSHEQLTAELLRRFESRSDLGQPESAYIVVQEVDDQITASDAVEVALGSLMQICLDDSSTPDERMYAAKILLGQ